MQSPQRHEKTQRLETLLHFQDEGGESVRIRTIKPDFFTHEGIFEAEKDTGLPLRLAFIGLWCAADRDGRFKWEPRRLGVQIFPYDGIDFSRVLDALTTRAFIRHYRVGDATFGCIPSWHKHQIINNRETQSCLPEPVDAQGVDASGTREPRVGHAGQGEGKGREGKEEDKKKEEPAPPPFVGEAPITLDGILANCGQYGVRPEVAESWWLANDAAGWIYRDRPLVNWQSSLKRYSNAWVSNDNRSQQKVTRNGGGESKPKLAATPESEAARREEDARFEERKRQIQEAEDLRRKKFQARAEWNRADPETRSQIPPYATPEEEFQYGGLLKL